MSVSVGGAALYWDRGARINDYSEMSREDVAKCFAAWGAPKEEALSAGVRAGAYTCCAYVFCMIGCGICAHVAVNFVC
jgi:hypothetical protein